MNTANIGQLTGAEARLLRHVTQTIVIDKWATGPETIYQNGDLNSGRANLQISGWYNPFLYPGTLSWSTPVVQIDQARLVVTDLILAGKTRVENGITYVYSIGNTGRVYKIQVNDPATFNPDYDNPVLLTTLTINTPTFTRGGFIDFFGVTEKIYISSDQGLTSINFDGSGEQFEGVLGSWKQNVPKPLNQFVGKLYIGNGPNIAEMDSTQTITTYTKLSPGFPSNTQVRDLDITPDGTYLQATVNQTALADITSATQDTTSTAPSVSYVFRWNGTDTGYTSYSVYPGVSLSGSILFENHSYVFGTDMSGLSIFNPTERIMQAPEQQPPFPNAVTNLGGMFMQISPLIFNGVMEADLYTWGAYDYEQGVNGGYQDIMGFNASGAETDVKLIPMLLPVSNTGFGTSSNGYAGNQYGTSKMYLSTLETSSTTSVPKLYKWRPAFTPLDTDNSAVASALYQTQTQLFSKKIQIKQVRVYVQPWVTGNSLQIDLIGSSGLPMANGTKVFTAGTNVTVGDDFAWWAPQVDQTYALGILLTNLGDTNNVINKVEIDYTQAGQ